ncbi:hypothetical protein AG1IA_05260 [Rhizoctonia solani AG-1 IA]|uniref:Uncharacterized protein n=1 Tax=Thanatephorus cucumeris (strain AG1-IA) TaxID=983506 RepID=L8WV86_THACA|nr:hypothetical protein AG1IA_05260 [Rhizoctonia solani AG-1 IA]
MGSTQGSIATFLDEHSRSERAEIPAAPEPIHANPLVYNCSRGSSSVTEIPFVPDKYFRIT